MTEEKKDLTLPVLLRKQRNKHTLTIEELSKISGISTSYLTRLESQVTPANPKLEILQKLAKTYDVSLITLINAAGYDTEEPFEPVGLGELLFSHQVTFKGDKLTEKQKEYIIKMLEGAYDFCISQVDVVDDEE